MSSIRDSTEGALARPVARPRCLVCQATATDSEALDPLLPPAHLCRTHWVDYRTDWLLLGWCVGHYAEALRRCPTHNSVVEPL